MADVTYRLVSDTDLENLSPLNPQSFIAATYDLHLSGMARFAVAIRAGEIVASEVLDFSEGDFSPEIRNLVVVPSARRVGIGVGLTSYLEAVARETGHSEVFVGGPTDNAGATALFISQDYLPTGEQRTRDYSWTDETGQTHSATQIDVMWRKSLARR